MKRWLVYLLPLLLVISSAASFYYAQIRQNHFIAISRQLPLPMDPEFTPRQETFNRPASMEPLYPKVSLLLFNGISEAMLEQVIQVLSKSQNFSKNIVSTSIRWQPITDIDFNYQTLISGLDPLRSDNFLKIASRESDSLAQVVLDYEGLVYTTESLQELFFPSDTLKESALSILNIEETSWKEGAVQQEEWVHRIVDFIAQLDADALIAISSLVPSSGYDFSFKPAYYFSTPLCWIGKDLQESIPFSDQEENSESLGGLVFSRMHGFSVPEVTATLAYALGLPSPTGNMGFPGYEIFSHQEIELSEGLVFGAQTYLSNALYALTDLGIDETITTGYFFQYTNMLDIAKNLSTAEIQKTILQMESDFQSFLSNEKTHSNVLPMIAAVLLMALLLIAWLLLLPYHYRGYIFGISWAAILLAIFYMVFHLSLRLPSLNDFTLSWIMTGFLWPFVLAVIVVAMAMTMIGGFLFNYSLAKVIQDMQAASGTLFVFLVVESAFFSIREGFLMGKMLPGFFFEALLYRNLAYITFLPLGLATMGLIAIGIYGISLRMSRKK